MIDPAILIHRLGAAISRNSYRFSNEAQLQEALADVLTAEGLTFTREHRLDEKSRVDFWLDGVLIEVKVDGSFSAAIKQCDRYCVYRAVTGVVLATTKRWGREAVHFATLREKPVAMVHLRRPFL